MDTQLQSLSKIFTEKLYRIPDYQRGYAWTDKQLRDFWGDIEQLEADKNHYVGVLTLERVPKNIVETWEDDLWIIQSKSFEPYYVVDGQQRLTTSIILIQCVIESIKRNDRLNYTTAKAIKEKFLFDSKDDGVSRSYIFGYEKDNPSYEYLKTRIFNEASTSGYQREETIYTQNLQYAKNFFKEKLSALKLPQKEAIFKKITQNLLFNIYSISSDIDVFVAFETMNNRGKPLSVLELLKNRLIYLSVRVDATEFEKTRLRRNINDSWKSVYHYLGKNKEKPLPDDVFLVNHLLLAFPEISSPPELKVLTNDRQIEARRQYNYVTQEFDSLLLETLFSPKRLAEKSIKTKPKLTIKYINDFIESLQKHVMIWYDLNNPSDASDTFSNSEIEWIEKIGRIGTRYSSTLLLSYYAARPHGHDSTSFLKKLEALLFIQIYIIRSLNVPFTINNIGLNFASKKIRFDEIEETVGHMLEEYREDPFFTHTASEQLKSGFYRWKGIYYFLFEYEMFLQSKTKNKRQKVNWNDLVSTHEDSATVEHIYPQNATPECFKKHFGHLTPQARKTIVDSLGNLVLVSKPKNSSMQNKCFKDKVDNGERVGYKFGSYSEIDITRYEDWTPEAIQQRGLQLLDFMSSRWGIDLGSAENKISILDLRSTRTIVQTSFDFTDADLTIKDFNSIKKVITDSF